MQRSALIATSAVAMNVRLAVGSDIPDMHRVRLSVSKNVLRDTSWVQPQHYLKMLNEHGRGWVCEMDGRIVGFAIADLARASIWALFVDPACERRGIGRRLHDTALDWLFSSGAAVVWLTTAPNTRAERFYARANWRYVGRQPNGEARFEMARERWQTMRWRHDGKEDRMLELRPKCECCDRDLPPESTDAFICSFECTFCRHCTESVLGGRCPNCGGELVVRPRRPPEKLEAYPASDRRVVKQERCSPEAGVTSA